jgi:hypothetical protein
MKKRGLLFLVAALAAIGAVALAGGPAGATGVNGTTLSATKTATGHFDRTFHWTIDKSVTPSHQDLFVGDSSTLNYTVSVTKDSGTDSYSVDGQVCVTNGGGVATQGLAILDQVEYKMPAGAQYGPLAGASQNISIPAELGPGESHCYPYSISLTPIANALYRNVAHVTITNHSGSLGDPTGPDPKADFSIPSTPTTHNDSVDVNDTNGESWTTDTSDSWNYDKSVECTLADWHNTLTFDNTATIQQTGDSADAEATVTCFGLRVSKTANTSFDRTYHWTIDKSADQSSLTLALNESFPVNYNVTVGLDSSNPSTDSNHAVAGTITVVNPAPIDATVNSVSDLVSGGIDGTVDCGETTFPVTLDALGGTLTCSYTAALPDASDRRNTATATLQNNDEGTTDFSSDPVDVSFANATRTDIDGSVDVSDSLQGSLGTVTYGAAPVTFSYQRTVGPYATCGNRTVDNTASFTTSDSTSTGSDSWSVGVNVPCAGGCTLTIGYWKTHSGYSNGNQADMVTPLLPVSLGAGGGKTVVVTTAAQAVGLLNKSSDASNGINKLYAQLLAAKLNIKAGASASAIASTIAAADAFLVNYNAADWSNLSKTLKSQVNTWASTLDSYNNGLIGPGHCSQ